MIRCSQESVLSEVHPRLLEEAVFPPRSISFPPGLVHCLARRLTTMNSPSTTHHPHHPHHHHHRTITSCRNMTTTTKFRALFVCTMIGTAIVFGLATYFILRHMESNTAEETFESIAASALEQAQAIAVRKQQGADSLANALSYAFPAASQWPFVGLRGYTQLATKVAAMSATAGHGFMAVVREDQIADFEAHTKELYERFQYPPKAGNSAFGFGIWEEQLDKDKCEYEDCRFHQNTTERIWNNRYNISIPFLQHKNTLKKPAILMRNLHQFELRGSLMERIIDCGNAAPANSTESPKCGSVTDFTTIFIRPGPSAVFFDPIFPADDPTTVVGFIGTSINWEEVLTDVVPDFVHGLDCVVSNERGDSFTYSMEHGQPRLVGEGDFHEDNYDHMGRSILLNDMYETQAKGSAKFTLTVYPTQEMYDNHSSQVPLFAAIGFVAVIVFCTLVFFLYDHFMKYEAHQRKVVLEAKRRFVRFVSHEIRTPLNVVCMGLDLMITELREHLDAIVAKDKEAEAKKKKEDEAKKPQPLFAMSSATPPPPSPLFAMSPAAPLPPTSSSPPTSGQQDTTTNDIDAEQLLVLANEIQENSQNAVQVLSDLLNFDRVTSGTFDLEFRSVHIFRSIRKTVGEFAIQARNRNINILTHTVIEGNDDPRASEERLFVLGDERRLNLVVRNLISNALKFCENKDIHVTISHLPKGLPDAEVTPEMVKEPEDHGMIVEHSQRAGAIRIAVKDNGVGLNQDQLALLFNEGVQFNPEILQHGGGSGLGLCLTREIVHQHQGRIQAASEGIGCGSEFFIDLPLFENMQLASSSKPRDKEGSTATSVTGSQSSAAIQDDNTHHVLVVDDVVTNTKMLARLLQRAGHKCETAANGQEAVEAFLRQQKDGTERPFDTILMDFEMPTMNGPQATERLRELGCKAYIFGLTGNVLAEDVATFKQSGAEIVLFKPINLPSLDSAWEDMDLKKKRRRVGVPAPPNAENA
ncbi:Autoinducer 1 sensor kinase/phosphatase LuxN [Seminavis robusta]|uniref:histidine kinase n=1 Tax=Seminavis robusta TaxID=568900 RepID=A0A9N8HVH9_9STRA|nr:Autoinducer 1 sensor kinase/phosphatase LuxN [Seminavis robusta]|eukprot:Sro2335_g323820.1 Autoinducer 1 sensor kinase/phosphatase LuxN (982) ;mRNA; r:7998-11318